MICKIQDVDQDIITPSEPADANAVRQQVYIHRVDNPLESLSPARLPSSPIESGSDHLVIDCLLLSFFVPVPSYGSTPRSLYPIYKHFQSRCFNAISRINIPRPCILGSGSRGLGIGVLSVKPVQIARGGCPEGRGRDKGVDRNVLGMTERIDDGYTVNWQV